jgi:manganese-dependent inorganic pyrophosphatase
MCAGIISDTLNLTSPTTTDEDRSILAWASEIAELDVDQFKEDFFSAGSVLRSSNITEAIGSDRKEFNESGYHLSISQVEEIGFDYFWPAREALNDSLLLIEAAPEIRERISYPRKDTHLFTLKGVVSRKKQLFPYLSSVLAEIPLEEEGE